MTPHINNNMCMGMIRLKKVDINSLKKSFYMHKLCSELPCSSVCFLLQDNDGRSHTIFLLRNFSLLFIFMRVSFLSTGRTKKIQMNWQRKYIVCHKETFSIILRCHAKITLSFRQQRGQYPHSIRNDCELTLCYVYCSFNC